MIIASMTNDDRAAGDPSATRPTEPGDVRHLILGTAGHIDHGKTTLIEALTGTNTDRLPEEKRRGMTIELGFAELALGELRFGVVDVPGHERFVRMMVAGATGIDVALLVVAADDSVMPQTIEHAEILHLLGVRQCVVAVTKIDAVEPDLVELVAEEVRSLLDPTPLAGSAVCPVSAVAGRGLSELKQALHAAADEVPDGVTQGPFRLPVDRVFTVAGRGTVVTGSVSRGRVHVGESVEVWPGGLTARVRGLQTHGVDREWVARGQRAALNLSQVERSALARGAELASVGFLQESRMLDVRVECLASQRSPLKSTMTVRLGVGTKETPARLVTVTGAPVPPGESAYAQLRCGEPIAATYGQRFILRDENAVRTIGGGVVLRPVARRRRLAAEVELAALQEVEHGDAAARVEDALRQAGVQRPTDLHLCSQAGVEPGALPAVLDQLRREQRYVPVGGTDVYLVPAVIDDLAARLTRRLERHHQQNPDAPGRLEDAVVGWLERLTDRTLARALLDGWRSAGRLKRLGAFICLPAFAPQLSAADEAHLADLIAEIKAGRFQPPLLEASRAAQQLDKKRLTKLATLAVALGELVRIEGTFHLHVECEAELRSAVARLVAAHGAVTVSQVREELNTVRKYAVPMLGHLDRVGFTRRVGDERVLTESASTSPEDLETTE